jgi:N-methylhydantoinase B/oxoprolinase/acetone carboxylase alpha subunit
VVPLIEVVVSTGTYEGGWTPANSAEASTPEAAIYTARVLWDESYTHTQGCRRRLTFIVDGDTIWTTESRP